MLERDEGFLDKMGELAAGYYPGLSERINELSYQGLGRAIVVGGATDISIELVGYILPINFEQSKHVLMFNSGLVMVTEPNPRIVVRNPNLYKVEFSPSTEPLVIDSGGSLQRGIHVIYTGTLFKGQEVILRSDNPAEKDQIKLELAQAFSFAEELKRKKDAAQKEIADELINSIDRLLLNLPKKEEEPK